MNRSTCTMIDIGILKLHKHLVYGVCTKGVKKWTVAVLTRVVDLGLESGLEGN